MPISPILEGDPEFNINISEISIHTREHYKERELGPRIQSIADRINKYKDFLTSEDKEAAVKLLTPRPSKNIKQDKLYRRKIRRLLRLKIGLLKKGDVVCAKSQGRIDSKFGPNACAVISAEAVKHFIKHKGIPNEETVYQIINDGIVGYKKFGFTDKVDFESVLGKITKDLQKPLVPIVPKPVEGLEKDAVEMMGVAPESIPYQGVIGRGLTNVLAALDKETKSNGCGVLTCNGETMVIYFERPGKPVLFDSHGRTYEGVSRGASVLHFDCIESLDEHLCKTLFKDKDLPYSLFFVAQR